MLCAWASIDEKGRTMGGKAGDQTGREVKTGQLYNFGQIWAIRAKSNDVAERIAKYAKAIAENDNVGYDQGQRDTLYKIRNVSVTAASLPPVRSITVCRALFFLQAYIPVTLFLRRGVPRNFQF